MKTSKQSRSRSRRQAGRQSAPFFSRDGVTSAQSSFFPDTQLNPASAPLHTGPKAAALAQALHAEAFTLNGHIFFNKNRYNPATKEGKRLLAHELTHVAQQKANPSLANTVQRYAVPGSLPCNQVVGWLNSNSPYSPEWAETKCEYSFDGNLSIKITNLKGGKVKMEVKGNPKLSVSVNCPIDSPEWQPDPRPNLAAEVTAWNNMKTVLDAHESKHRKIGKDHRVIIEKKYRAVNFTKTGDDEADARSQVEEKVFGDQQAWIDAAQAAQDKIDPFRGARLVCPAPAPTTTNP
jgi:hypothetical protein